MKKIILSLLLGMFLISLVIATTLNTFTIGLTEENITFTGTQSYIRNLSIPDGTYLTNASITLEGLLGYPTSPQLEINGTNVWNGTGSGDDLFEYYDGSGNNPEAFSDGMLAQNFTIGTVGTNDDINLTIISVILNDYGTSTGNITAKLYAVDGDGHPTGAILSSGSANIDSLPNSNTWVNFSMSNYELQASTTYVFTLNYSGAGGTNDTRWMTDDTSPTYSGGNYMISSDNGATWSDEGGNDGQFKVYGVGDLYSGTETIDIASTLNSYISTCTTVSGNCTIPFNFTATDGNLSYSALLFTNDGFLENSQTYSSSTTELSEEEFKINISYDSNVWTSITAILNYNGTNYTATSSTGSGNTREFSRTITTPEVTSQTNYTFYWLIRLTNSSGTYFYESTTNNQTVNNINIDDCSAYSYKLLNLTLKDEETQVAIENGTIEVDIDIYNADGTSTIDYYNKFEDDSNVAVCLDNNLSEATLYLDSKIKYYSDEHSTEYYNIKDYVLNEDTLTQNITLYDLNTSSTTTFDIYYKDDNFNIVADALIQITREYVEEGVFKTIEIPITDIDGKATASLIKNTGIYTFYVYEDGELKATFNNVIATCENELTEECQINLNEPSSTSTIDDFVNLDDLNYNIQYNKATKLITFDFSIPSGATGTLNLLVDVFDEYENETICDESVTSASGTLTCTIPDSYVNQTAIIKLYKDDEFVSSYFISLAQDPTDYFGYSGLFFALIMIIMIPFMFITSIIGVVVGMIIGIIMASLLLLSTGANIYSITGGIIWFIVAGVILIWKLNSTERRYG